MHFKTVVMKRFILSRLLLAIVICLIYNSILVAQSDTLYYLNSNFETPEDQANWSSLPVDASIKWDYHDGGENFPISAKSGDYNARFYRSDLGESHFRTLVSEALDLSTAERPELTFWYAQAPAFAQDELRILFKAG